MFLKLIFYIGLVAVGCYLIIKEEQLAQFEHDLFRAIKRLFSKP